MNVKLVSVTPDAEKLIAKCARVSSPNPDNPEIEKLLSYCIKNDHWSIFEQSFLTVEVETSIPIAMQILRHKSLFFQQFSARYSKVPGFEIYPGRSQDLKNRQNSIDNLSVEDQSWFMQTQQIVNDMCMNLYQEALNKSISKESARFLLPQSAKTKMYVSGNVRSFIHYIQVRTEASTQKEHRDIANEIKKIFVEQFPIISNALGWKV